MARPCTIPFDLLTTEEAAEARRLIEEIEDALDQEPPIWLDQYEARPAGESD